MLDTAIIVILMVLLAIVTGSAMDLRDANVQLQRSHDEAMLRAAQEKRDLRFDIETLGAACDRWAHFDRVATRKMSDQAKIIHDLEDQVSSLSIDLLKVKLGGTLISEEQQSTIDANVTANWPECH